MSSPETRLGGLAGLAALAAGPALAAPDCQSSWRETAAPFEGLVFGTNTFELAVADGLGFSLKPDDSGWHVEMLGDAGRLIPSRPVASGIPPVKGENDPSEGFVFGPDVLDPALNPDLTVPGSPANIATVEPTPGKQGRGWYTATEQGFSETKPYRKIYMRFEGCILWYDGPREPDVSHYPEPQTDLVNFAGWVVTAMEDCGLPDTLLLSGRMPRPGYRNRAWLEPDLDGDGRHDLLVLVDRPEDDRHGLAACLQDGKRLLLKGLGPDAGDSLLTSDFLEHVDWWSVNGRTAVIGYEGAGSQRVFLDEAGNLASEWYGD